MKIKSKDKVVVNVKGFIYGTNGDESPKFDKTYKGEYEKVLLKVCENHSYSFEEGLSVDELLESIIETNGDGCDSIFDMTIKTDKETFKVIEEDEEGFDCEDDDE